MNSSATKSLSILALSWLALACSAPNEREIAGAAPERPGYTGSESCRECHEKFYELWAPSHHGLAMQPFTPELAKNHLTPQEEELEIDGVRYRAVFDAVGGRVVERGPDGEKSYPIVHAMGGKNVYYFLTPFERGRLQTLPVAYDVNAETWFDMAGSAVMHAAPGEDEPFHWTDWPYTFNTGCYGCHVSQLDTNYDLASDSYESTWAEPGINCEACHDGGAEHVRVCRDAPEGEPPEDLKIIVTRDFDAQQMNDLCAPCHLKGGPLTANPRPGSPLFDNYHLVAFESADFYPDGRDLAENYTHTPWLTSPCVKSGQLDCNHCHTPSGRFRQARNPNASCLPCHEARVNDPTSHTRHRPDSPGSLCINCHMPGTSFARMTRHDHSMLPPTPAATLEFESPNACNLCHEDRDAQWADRQVREWHQRDYQAPLLHRARLIDAARKEDWSELDEMLAYVANPERDEVFAASLIRLLRACEDDRKWPAIVTALRDPSPLVRSSAAEALGGRLDPSAIAGLVDATRDEYRLVRIRAAAALAGVPPDTIRGEDRRSVERAVEEYKLALGVRPDDAYSHYNLGNFHLARGEYRQALSVYGTAVRLRPDTLAAHVNAAHAYSAVGDKDQAEASLRRAVEIDSANPVALFNLGLLLAEMGRNDEAMDSLRAALEADANLAAAAFNLGILVGETDPREAVRWCERAASLRPDDARYAYTLAYYQKLSGRNDDAVATLRRNIERQPLHGDSFLMLGAIYEELGRLDEARALYRRGAGTEELDIAYRRSMEASLRSIEP